MRFASSTSVAALVLACAACAAAPPPLPADTTGITRAHTLAIEDFSPADRQLSCADIRRERTDLRAGMAQADAAIRENRPATQGALFLIGVLALPMIDDNQGEKAVMEKARLRLDTLSQLSAVRTCGPA